MTRAEALARGYCGRCASYSAATAEAAARQWCGIGAKEDVCGISPEYGEWLRQAFSLPGPRLAQDLGVFAGVRPARG